jgi:hypothetical protein
VRYVDHYTISFYDVLVFIYPFLSTLHSFVKDVVSVVDVLIRLCSSPYFILRSTIFLTIGIVETFQTPLWNAV